ncbi:hypothetical protein ABFY54_28865 [Priestia megaterium]|uniref:hypothetical protein n=1 Tax=Priestia megaterium TaxID=1404 RepID=UPI003D2E7AB7
MKTYRIDIDGCDDTNSFLIDLRDEEFKLLEKIKVLSNEHSLYACQPTLDIYEASEFDKEQLEEDEDE